MKVLSTVFQNYIGAMAPIMSQYQTCKEESLRHAFQCLEQQTPIIDTSGSTDKHLRVVDAALIREAFKMIRPHYSATKVRFGHLLLNPMFIDQFLFKRDQILKIFHFLDYRKG